MKARTTDIDLKRKESEIPVHSLEYGSTHVNILPLDYNNPYDYKREHRHTYFEIMLIARGGGNQLIDFNNYPALDNSCYIISPQQVHLMNRNGSLGTIIQFTEEKINSPELRAALKDHSFDEKAAVIFENRQDLLDGCLVLTNMIKAAISRDTKESALSVTHLLCALVSLLLENRVHAEQVAIDQHKKLLLHFYQLLDVHYCENLSVKGYVQKLATTEKKLAVATAKYAGLSPLQVIHNRILLEAKRILLFEDSSHKEISFRLGFDSPSSFSSFIKTKTGFTPSELSKYLVEIHK
ncbi:MAG: helix-turn-helix domain-containing protein [Flavobacterium sp.]|nr:helix-turn-helix domain-containing protein [Flavobacterium sp.]